MAGPSHVISWAAKTLELSFFLSMSIINTLVLGAQLANLLCTAVHCCGVHLRALAI